MEKKLKELCFLIYKELYENSTPPADFEELYKNAKYDKYDKKIIPYMDYVIDEDLYNEIIQKYVDKAKLSKYYKNKVKVNIALGPSPNFKQKK